MNGLSSVAESHCVVARQREEQLEAKSQSVTQVNSIRPSDIGEPTRYWRSLHRPWSNIHVRNVTARDHEDSGGDWRRNGQKASHMNERDLFGTDGVHATQRSVEVPMVATGPIWRVCKSPKSRRTGVRGVIVAMKPVKADGAKGSRKVDAS